METDAKIEEPIQLLDMRAPPEWMDYNGHMNVAYYTMAVDQAMDVFFESYDLGEAYLRERQASLFMVEQHTNYLAEIPEGQRFVIHGQLLSLDEKRFQMFFTLTDPESGTLFATSETMGLHVDMRERRSTPFPQDRFERLEALAKAHATLPRPRLTGRAIGLPRRKKEQG